MLSGVNLGWLGEKVVGPQPRRRRFPSRRASVHARRARGVYTQARSAAGRPPLASSDSESATSRFMSDTRIHPHTMLTGPPYSHMIENALWHRRTAEWGRAGWGGGRTC